MDIPSNKKIWNEDYNWSQGGEEWSAWWGNSSSQWQNVILPRIHSFLPSSVILEIGPGFGRWSRFLKDHCSKLIFVDLSEKCIEACRSKFKDSPNIEYYVNDGRSLAQIADESLDFVFSFDSLVHAEADVIEAYMAQLSRKLKPKGAVFIHHSNLGDYLWNVRLQQAASKVPGLFPLLKTMNLSEDLQYQYRAASMTARKMREYAMRYGLKCVSQELVNWGSKALIDCMTTVVRKDSSHSGESRIFRNPDFMKQAARILELSRQTH